MILWQKAMSRAFFMLSLCPLVGWFTKDSTLPGGLLCLCTPVNQVPP
jgi:hypothetical protein